jgi:hypothetical protein
VLAQRLTGLGFALHGVTATDEFPPAVAHGRALRTIRQKPWSSILS